jgi:hypothetical protein
MKAILCRMILFVRYASMGQRILSVFNANEIKAKEYDNGCLCKVNRGKSGHFFRKLHGYRYFIHCMALNPLGYSARDIQLGICSLLCH